MIGPLQDMNPNVRLKTIGIVESNRRLSQPSLLSPQRSYVPIAMPGMFASGKQAIWKLIGGLILSVSVVLSGVVIWKLLNWVLDYFRIIVH